MVPRAIVETLQRYAAALDAAGVSPHQLVLYGSHASGHARPDSDIDVGVISPALSGDRFDDGVRLRLIARQVSPDLEPVPLTPRTWEEDTWVPLVWEIRTKGIPLSDLPPAA